MKKKVFLRLRLTGKWRRKENFNIINRNGGSNEEN